MQALGSHRARAGRAWAAQGRAGLGRWARADRHGRRAWALGVARGACVGARADARAWHGQALQAGGRAQGGRRRGAGGRARAGERQLGRRCWARGRQGAGRAAGRRWARGARAAWAPGLALGSALGALGPFSIRFDSFFFPESLNEHRSL